MKNSEKTEQKGRKLKSNHILILLLIVVVLVLAFLRFNMRRTLLARLEAIRAEGYPVTFEELNAWYSIPLDSENAAYFVLDAENNYNEPNDEKLLPVLGNAELPGRTEAMDDETKERISQFVDKNQKCLELLHKTAGLEYGRYPVDFTFGNGTRLSHLDNFRNLEILLYFEAILASEDGIQDKAVQSVISLLGLANSLDKEPLVISQLICLGCDGCMVSSLEYVINRIVFSDEELKNITVSLAEAEKSHEMLNAVIGERCMSLDILMYPKTQYLDPSSSPILSFPPMLFLYEVIGLNESDAIFLLDYMNDVVKAFNLPPERRQEEAGTLNTKINQIPKRRVLLRRFIPSFERIIIMDLSYIAKLRVTQAALAVQRYRLKYKKLPDSLDNLVPDYLESVPLDPFEGKELKYKKLDLGFVIYSIGEDQIDDGGKEQTKSKKKTGDLNYDITFIIER